MSSKIGLIIRREYLERVRKKSFILTTILMPVVMLGLMAAPVMIQMFSEGSKTRLAVVDDSGVIATKLQSTPTLTLTVVNEPVDSVRADEAFDGVLVIPGNVLEPGAVVKLFTNESSSLTLEQNLSSQINSAIEEERMRNYNIENLNEILDSIKADITIQNLKNLGEDGEAQASTIVSYMLGMVLTLLLYMCLLIYGQMVMTSILEEKGNRVLEIVVSSINPTQLMLGKILGICAVAVTQILIWGVLMLVMSGFLLPMLLPAEMLADVNAMNAGADLSTLATDAEVLSALSIFGDAGYLCMLFGVLILFLAGGFMLYAAIYAAIGSAVDNIQDASQLQTLVVLPVVAGIICGVAAASDPNSQLAFWTSIFPFTSPMVMMARLPFGVPVWQIVVSAVVLYASFYAMVWFAAKIYRIGIFMYGKKPSIAELIRWARYK